MCFLVLFCLLALERVRKSKVTWIKRWGGSGRKWVGEKHDQYLFYENVFYSLPKAWKERTIKSFHFVTQALKLRKGKPWAPKWPVSRLHHLPPPLHTTPVFSKKENHIFFSSLKKHTIGYKLTHRHIHIHGYTTRQKQKKIKQCRSHWSCDRWWKAFYRIRCQPSQESRTSLGQCTSSLQLTQSAKEENTVSKRKNFTLWKESWI